MWLETVHSFMCFCLASPPPPLALIIGNREIVTFVEDLQQGPEKGNKRCMSFLLLNVAFCTDRINNYSCATTQIGAYQGASHPCWVHRVPAASSVIGVATQRAPFS